MTNTSTPAAYVASLAPDRRAVIAKLRTAIKRNLPAGFKETVGYGIAYVVPHSLYPAGYHCDPKLPLPFINLASQKQYVSLYHMGLYDRGLVGWLKTQWPKHSEAKLDLGKCCIRMRRPEHIPYELIGELAAKMSPRDWITTYERAIK